jgi:hypothetical protein
LLAHLPGMARSLARAWGARPRRRAPGAGIAAVMMCVALALGIAGGVLALSRIDSWHGRRHDHEQGRAQPKAQPTNTFTANNPS